MKQPNENENAAALEAAAEVPQEQAAEVAGLPTETVDPVVDPVVDQPTTATEEAQPAKPKAFSIARVDACVLRMWEHVNAGAHGVIEEIELLLGIEKE